MGEEEPVEPLVALYTSLAEHEKGLVLIENTELRNSSDGMAGYLASSMRATYYPDVVFNNLKWLYHRAQNEAQGKSKLDQLVRRILSDPDDLEMAISRLMEALFQEIDDLSIEVIKDGAPAVVTSQGLATENALNKPGSKEDSACVSSKSTVVSSKQISDRTDVLKKVEVSADATEAEILARMVRADSMSKSDVFDKLRALFNERIVLNAKASYHDYTLLKALQNEPFKELELQEDQAYLLAKQGRHETAADELAETSLKSDEVLTRLTRMLPVADKANAAEKLVSAYLRVSTQG